jgi:iron-sulfur cluster repair protein YtfE (RIC family)
MDDIRDARERPLHATSTADGETDMDVLEHLTEEHRKVERLLESLAKSDEGPGREQALDELQSSLDTHMAVEERFLYPIVLEVVGEEDEEGAENEHGLARDGLKKMRELVDQPGFGAAVEMVKAGIGHHVEEEEHEIFPKLRSDAADRVAALGEPDQLEAEVTKRGRGSDDLTKAELYEQAKEADIEGRSGMTKDQLADALDKR